jgi:hypothetical protein
VLEFRRRRRRRCRCRRRRRRRRRRRLHLLNISSGRIGERQKEKNEAMKAIESTSSTPPRSFSAFSIDS